MKLEDLKPFPRNPRDITDEARGGLRVSMEEFGDLSGIVWNKRDGYLVCGHQRVDALKVIYGDALKLTGKAIVTPTGERFPVRTVDWDADKALAANIAANNPHIAGTFSADLPELLIELRESPLGEMMGPLRLDMLMLPPIPEGNKPIDEEALGQTENECPSCGFKW